MKYGALFGWGIAIYAVLSLAWSGFVIYNVAHGIGPRVAEFVLLVALAYIAGRSLRFGNWKDVLPYSLTWALEAVILDAVFTVPFGGWGIYASPTLWVGYAILAAVPLLSVLYRNSPQLPEHLTS